MYCTNCGTPRPEGATLCPGCGRAYQVFGGSTSAGMPPIPMQGVGLAPGTVPNYLVQSVLITLCCCLPFGIVGIVYSAQVNTHLAAGNLAAAEDASRKAKMWDWIGFGCGILAMLVYGVIGAGGALSHMR